MRAEGGRAEAKTTCPDSPDCPAKTLPKPISYAMIVRSGKTAIILPSNGELVCSVLSRHAVGPRLRRRNAERCGNLLWTPVRRPRALRHSYGFLWALIIDHNRIQPTNGFILRRIQFLPSHVFRIQ